MSHEIVKLVRDFEKIKNDLIDFYKSSHKEFFFTEKEIHSYFYHLCLKSGLFITKSGFNLIHTEYPTPFKCTKLDSEPYIKLAGNKSNKIRSHIDLVLLNPNFVEWIFEKGNDQDIKYITGLSNEPYLDYIKGFETKYLEIQEKCHEKILLYAIEFKYYRYNSTGISSAERYILYDKNKLVLLKRIKIEKVEIDFCSNVKSLVFIGHRLKDKLHDLYGKLADNDCEIT